MTRRPSGLTRHLVEHLEGLLTRWAGAVETSPTREPFEQRDVLRADYMEPLGIVPEALVLKVLDEEIRRREPR